MCICQEFPALIRVSDRSKLHDPLDYKVEHDYEFFSVGSCADCFQKWLLKKDSGMYIKLEIDEQLQTIDEWLEHDRSVAHFIDSAREIGSAADEFFEVPCKAKLKDGRELDYCVLSKWVVHPVVSWSRSIFSELPAEHFVYPDEVESIEPSEYALSLQNRRAMHEAGEVIWKDTVALALEVDDETYFREYGLKNFYLDSNFLRAGKIKGSDVKRVTQDFEKFRHGYSEQDNLREEIVVIPFDKF